MQRREFLGVSLLPFLPEINVKSSHLSDDLNRPWMMMLTVLKNEDDGEEYHEGLINFGTWSEWREPYKILHTRTCTAELIEPRKCFYCIDKFTLALQTTGIIEVKQMKYRDSDSFYTIRANEKSECLATKQEINQMIGQIRKNIRDGVYDEDLPY